MRSIVLFSCALVTATPAFAVWSFPEEESRLEEDVSDRDPSWNYQQFLYDEIAQDAITDGHASEVVHACLNFEMRLRRSDGRILVRRLDRCD